MVRVGAGGAQMPTRSTRWIEVLFYGAVVLLAVSLIDVWYQLFAAAAALISALTLVGFLVAPVVLMVAVVWRIGASIWGARSARNGSPARAQ